MVEVGWGGDLFKHSQVTNSSLYNSSSSSGEQSGSLQALGSLTSTGTVSRLIGWLKCCFTSTETVGLLGTGAQNSHLDFHTAPELWLY